MKFWPPMHELAICQALIRQVTEVADEKSATAVSDIFVSVGPLSGVESALLQNAFPIAAAGTMANGAELHIENLPVRVYCGACDIESAVAANRLLCDRCGGWQTKVVSGDELLLTRVELEHNAYPQLRTRTAVDEMNMES
jgi:hydrogenase nickel incorporation protein HypA/HybF